MLFRNKNKQLEDQVFEIKLKDTVIERVTDFNFLGIFINKNLNRFSHISKISTKVSKSIDILCKLKYFLPVSILKLIYCSLIQSQFYIWYTSFHI